MLRLLDKFIKKVKEKIEGHGPTRVKYAIVKLRDDIKELGIPEEYIHPSYYVIEIYENEELVDVLPYDEDIVNRLRKEMPVLYESKIEKPPYIFYENVIKYEH